MRLASLAAWSLLVDLIGIQALYWVVGLLLLAAGLIGLETEPQCE